MQEICFIEWENLNENSPTIHTDRKVEKMCRPNCNRCASFFIEAGGLKSEYKIIIFMKRLSELSHSNKLYRYKFEYNHSFMDIFPSSSFWILVVQSQSGAYRYGKQWQCGISWKSILLLIMLQLLSIFFPSFSSISFAVRCSLWYTSITNYRYRHIAAHWVSIIIYWNSTLVEKQLKQQQ